jgi:hypothetical protein
MKLINVEQRARQHPDTFVIPDTISRHNLKAGQLVKLIFDDRERMWVKVTEVLGGGSYKGTLDNKPVVVDMSLGDAVEFEAEHVASIWE